MWGFMPCSWGLSVGICKNHVRVKNPERNDLTIPADVVEKYFPRSFTPMKMQEVIIKLLE